MPYFFICYPSTQILLCLSTDLQVKESEKASNHQYHTRTQHLQDKPTTGISSSFTSHEKVRNASILNLACISRPQD